MPAEVDRRRRPAAADALLPRPFRVVDDPPGHPRHGDPGAEPLDGDGLPFAAGPVHDAAGVRRRRGADLDQRGPRPAGPAGAHHPRRRRGDAGPVRGTRRRRAGGPRPLRPRLGGRRTAPAATSSSSPAASGSRRCGPRCWRCSRTGTGSAGSRVLYGARTDGRRALRRRAARAGRPGRTSRWRSPSTGPAPSWTGRVGAGHRADPGRVVRPGRTLALRVRAGGDDALRRGGARRARRAAPTACGCPWSATCGAASACAATASCASTSSASTARCSPSTGVRPHLGAREL